MGSQSAPCINHWWMNWPDWHDLFLKLIGLLRNLFLMFLYPNVNSKRKTNCLLKVLFCGFDRKSTCYCFMGLKFFSPSVLQWWFYSRLNLYNHDHFQQLVLSDFRCLLAKIAKRKCSYFTVSLYLHYCNYNWGGWGGGGLLVDCR